VYYEANIDGIILEISPSIEKNSKYKREELIGKSLYDVYTNPEERNKLVEALIKDGSVNEYELNLTDKDDTQHICSINSMLIKDKNGNPIKIVGIMRDISDRKKAEKEKLVLEEKLLRSKKMESLGLLAGGVAHDLNNVLSGIVSYPELILIDLPEDSKLRKPIEIMQESGQRAAAIVQDLLTVARGVATTKEVLNLNELIGDYL
ncbi:MAG: PAS domain-containing protein, partial [Deltaproteobacteria bacterium]|nr:PAS domain-containing protein [Deltaproteobacteria bacterium]